MEVSEFIKKATGNWLHFLPAHFPRLHMVLASALVFLLGGLALLPSEEARAIKEARLTETVEISLPTTNVSKTLEFEETDDLYFDQNAELENKSVSHLSTVEEVVRSGDSLSVLFKRAGLSDRDMFEITKSSKAGKDLANLRPGHKFVFKLDQDKKLVSLVHNIDRLTSQAFTRAASGEFEHNKTVLEPDVKTAIRSGTIESSLYLAGKKAGMSEDLIMALASIYGWDIDFALDLRKGDTFKLLFEESFLAGERLGSGPILAAEFVNQGQTFRAVRYVREDGKVEYFTPTGKAMEKAFLRAPLDFRRISSNFNPRRLHPVTGSVRPHRGTDYAAKTGTPVWASGDGRVLKSGYNKANGNYVVIQHGGNVQTKYLHLHKRSVKTGQRVRQKQLIGTVGSTGYSTGPHLHYEFLLNGVHRNPRTIINKLPKAESIPKKELARFYQQTQGLLAQLDGVTQMAVNEQDLPTAL